MSNQLHLAAGLSLPLDIITMRIAIYGTSGAGKTTFGRLLAEKIHDAGHRFCAIDLKNDWWGLKSSADGAKGAIPVVVFGGPRKDIQLFDDAGATVADTIAAIDQSAIVDLDAFSKGKQLKFVTAFLERLYDVNRDPIMLLADEADRYAPQKAMSVEANISLGAAEDICRRGRKRGIGSLWLTQRTAVLNKNVADICDLTVVFRTPGSRDLKELEDRVARVADRDQVREVMRLAPGLADGQAIFLSSHPKLRDCLPAGAVPVQLPLPRTFDSSSTPGVGKRRTEPKVLAKADLRQIEARMEAQVERAKAEDPAALRRELVDLRQQVRNWEARANKLPTAQTSVFTDQDRGLLDALSGRLDKYYLPKLQALRERLEKELTPIAADIRRIVEISNSAAGKAHANMQNNLHNPSRPPAVPVVRQAAPQSRNGATPAGENDFRPSATQQRILDALAWYSSIGQDQPSALQVGAVALIDATGGHFSNTVGPLSSNGLLVRGNGVLALTEQGRALAKVPENVGTLEQYHAMLSQRVRKARSARGKTVEILQAVIRRGGGEITSTEIGAEVGIDPSGGHFSNTIGPLGTLGLIERRAGVVRPTEILFPRGLS